MKDIKRYLFAVENAEEYMTEVNNGSIVRYEDHSAMVAALQEQVRALTAENIALKSAFNPEGISEEAVEAFTETAILDHDWDETGSWSWVDNDTDVIRAVLAAIKPETPATDSALREIQAQGINRWIESRGGRWNGTTKEAEEYAASIRAGEQP